MIRILGTAEEIAGRIKEKNQFLIIYGAGMIGRTIMPSYIQEMHLVDYVDCYIDIDKRKQGKSILIGGKSFLVYAPEKLENVGRNAAVIITNSNFMPIVDKMNHIPALQETEVYIWPVVLEQQAAAKTEKISFQSSGREVKIPQKIHYCWFSGNPMPDYLKRCIETWHFYCPDYEIIRWDESNYDIGKNKYMKQAYEQKKWGFVPDIARLDLLYQYGGIYLDTDVELLKSLDELLYLPGFAGVEKWGNINLGGCSGCMAGNPVIKAMLDFRANETFIDADGEINMTTCGYYETQPLIEMGFIPNNTVQTIQQFTIFSSDFFCPYDYMSGKISVNKNTFSIHHFNGGWLDEKSMTERKKTQRKYQTIIEGMEQIAKR
ncbi:MAG: hypothetical protein K2P44_08615 [Lachnospiraceae bacterium]|nr:hypothetical protein [Lachnospiraceae bacterium]